MTGDHNDERPDYPVHGDVFEGSKLAVARSAVQRKLIFCIADETWPASMYCPAVLSYSEVGQLVTALRDWLAVAGKP